MKWHGGLSAQYGEKWSAGDVIGCGIEMFSRTIRFWRNGRDLGKAFSMTCDQLDRGHYPAMSLSAGQGCVINFGQTNLKYPSGYKPFLEGTATSDTEGAISRFYKPHR
jgi:Kip1 ubiquitination-promoting complex protein 1